METKRISHTVLKPAEGFRAQIPGLDLATLIQMAASNRERMVVRVGCEGQEGHLFFDQGQLVHAVAQGSLGEAAVVRMLGWTRGEFTVCQRAWPRETTIKDGTEALLIRAAQARDEGEAGGFAREPNSEAKQRSRSELQNSRKPSPRPASAALSLAPAPRASNSAASSTEEPAMIASVRIDMNGEVISEHGHNEHLAPLVAYVTRMGALLGTLLGLESFDALHVELGSKRLLVFADGGEMVGLMMSAGPAVNELRQQLGV